MPDAKRVYFIPEWFTNWKIIANKFDFSRFWDYLVYI